MFKKVFKEICNWWAPLAILIITGSLIAWINTYFSLHMKVNTDNSLKGIPYCIEVVGDFYSRAAAKGRHMLPVSAEYSELNVFFVFNPQNQDFEVLCLINSLSKAVKLGCLKPGDYQMPCYTGPLLFLYYEGVIPQKDRKGAPRIQKEKEEWKSGSKS